MSSREEKLAAARKKLREFQGKARENDTPSKARLPPDRLPSESSSSSPSVHFQDSFQQDERSTDTKRLQWERRETLDINEAQMASQIAQEVDDVNVQMDNGDYHQEDVQIFHEREAQLFEQLRRQNQAINVLVSERNDAQTALSRVQAQLHEKSDSLEDTRNKLLETTQRLRDLEQLPTHRSSPSLQLVQSETHAREMQNSQQYIQALRDQIAELQQKLDTKTTEVESAAIELRDLRNELSIADIKIQQLSTDDSPSIAERITALEDEKRKLEIEISTIGQQLQTAAIESQQSRNRFQLYADQCASHIASLKEQVQGLTEENATLIADNEKLCSRVTSLTERLKQLNDAENPAMDKLAQMRKSLAAKDAELSVLRSYDNEKAGRISELESVVARLEEETIRLKSTPLENTRADPALLAAMESDKVAASRAVAQNHKLKEQISELEAAFVRLSNEKSELMVQLDKESHENRELKKQLDCQVNADYSDEEDLPEDIPTLRSMVSALRQDKTQLMLRLQAKSETSHHSHNHDHSHDHNSHDHEQHEDCEHDDEHHHDHQDNSEELDELRRAIAQLQSDKDELLKRLQVPEDNAEVHGLLEAKLRRTMDEIAALDEEKQKLEHLVLQLQGETETIGEYISLYQKQRMLLRRRSIEKDEQLAQLSKDREDLRSKLASLNELVDKMVQGNNIDSRENSANNAVRIKELISEIGRSNVVNSTINGFEHCSCCSGRLITV